MEYRNYLNYKVYENGNVVNKRGIILKPKKKGNYYFYFINGLQICIGKIVLFSFGIYPKNAKQRVKRLDGNFLNNSLNNLSW